ncbi:hypothetical protein [Phenylobacterium sp.]|uniref:hypothetical protein n=1 Tax=Phenylobacterium sp. TaxID=1871053 RepID=UPI00261FB52D|nr:hypothetical protein [Phenylobacterium sp.]
MSDVYRWFDPFAEREEAFREGRDAVLRSLEYEFGDDYRRGVEREVIGRSLDDARHFMASLGMSKRLEAQAFEIVERVVRQDAALALHASQPELRVMWTPERGVDFYGSVKLTA